MWWNLCGVPVESGWMLMEVDTRFNGETFVVFKLFSNKRTMEKFWKVQCMEVWRCRVGGA